MRRAPPLPSSSGRSRLSSFWFFICAIHLAHNIFHCSHPHLPPGVCFDKWDCGPRYSIILRESKNLEFFKWNILICKSYFPMVILKNLWANKGMSVGSSYEFGDCDLDPSLIFNCLLIVVTLKIKDTVFLSGSRNPSSGHITCICGNRSKKWQHMLILWKTSDFLK